jgi:tRNA nucleotidyltransferase (CCA-adding enzyme)
MIPGGLKVDVASARLEYYEHPAALPKVEWSSIKLDLYRRDFTINTFAIQLNRGSWGNLIDFFGATRDIKEKFIRVLHNLSFVEDPSRIFRAIRFEQRLSFRFSKLTRSLIENTLKMEFIKSLSSKRLFMELQLMLQEEKVLSIIKRLAEFNLLAYIHPAIDYNAGLKAVLKNCAEVLSWFNLLFLDKACERWLLFFIALTDQLSQADAEALCARFHLNKRHADTLRLAKCQGLEVLKWLLAKRSFKNSELYRRLSELPVEVCLYIMAKTSHPVVKRAVSLYFTHLQNISIHVKGDDLIRMGIKPGKIYTRILDDVHDAVLDERVAGRDGELAYVRKKYAREMNYK